MAEDLRVIKTKENIESHFIELLNRYPFQEITVKMLIAECKINRSTFYRNYEDKYQLLEEITEKLLRKYKKTIYPDIMKIKSDKVEDFEKFLLPMVNYFYENESVLLALNKDTVPAVIFDRMYRIMSEMFLEEITLSYNIRGEKATVASYFSNVIASNLLTTMRWWHLEHPELPKDKIMEILVKCITKGVYSSMHELEK
ncbi:MAG: TetR/AcrR family transcriptional regulator [Oscillospiraceae bacterium]|nr:TetR/AcrR family transcriptional regulator [Oscillospiraceae bacterium]MBQ8594969.1 TetR/AcrR family transcriptional regulator [Oscillospiraceae bacterium]